MIDLEILEQRTAGAINSGSVLAAIENLTRGELPEAAYPAIGIPIC